MTGRPRALFKYKVQPFQRVGGKEYSKIALKVLQNQLTVTLPLALFKAAFTPSDARPETVPGPLKALGLIIFNVLCTEVGFYQVHSFLHSPWWYARFHKQHHEFTAPVGLAATYCTAFEHVFSNLLPNTLGTSLTQSHWGVMMFVYCFLSVETIMAHSGYNVPFTHSSLNHDFHHFAFDENFGPTGLMDTIYGTNKKYKRTLQQAKLKFAGDTRKARAALLSQLAAEEIKAGGKEL